MKSPSQLRRNADGVMQLNAGFAVDMISFLSKVTDVTFTQKDEDLLALLRLNAREPVASLARKLKLSRTTVQDRIKRLEEQGVIAGYAVRLASAVDKSSIRAYVTISVEARRQVEVGRALSKLPQIEALHTVAGKFDLVALARTTSAEDMDRMLDSVGLVPGVTRTESAIILSTKVDRR